MAPARRYFGQGRFLNLALGWLFAFGILLQVVSAPELLLRDATAIADPIRASQLLCDQASAGAPLKHHHKIPTPEALQCLLSHGGFGVAFMGAATDAVQRGVQRTSFLLEALAAITLAPVFAAYSARAPPILIQVKI